MKSSDSTRPAHGFTLEADDDSEDVDDSTPDSRAADSTIFAQRIEKERRLAVELMLSGDAAVKDGILSTNAKTGFAFNIPCDNSCRPTPICQNVCYASQPNSRMMQKQVIKMTLRVRYFLMENTPEIVAHRILDEARRLRRLRFLGHGDLIPKLVEVINIVARRRPDLSLWVTTRKPGMAKRLDRAENIKVWFSLDESADSWRRWQIVKDAGFHFSFLRTTDAPVPRFVELIYPQQAAGLPFDLRNCPADYSPRRFPRKGACERCGFCYNSGPKPPMALAHSWASAYDDHLFRMTLRYTSRMSPEMRRRELEDEPEDDDPSRWEYDDEEHDDLPAIITPTSHGGS